MKDRLNQFIDNTIGHFIEVSYKEAIYQCMDLAYAWIFTLDFPKATIQNQYAYQVYTNPKEITFQYFDLIPNTPSAIPQDGDIVVWNKTSGNVAGHIAVALGGGTTSKFKCFEQNSPLGTNAHIGDKTYTNVLGWLRPKIKESGVVEPQWFKQLLLERNLSLEREGEFRAFWEKAIKYDDEINSLKNQIVSTNEALAERATEVSALTEANQKLSDRASEAEAELNTKRNEISKTSWELTQANLRIEALEDEITRLTKELDSFKEKNNLYAYSWTDRFLSIFRR